MALSPDKRPVLDARANEILNALARGQTREELAAAYGYLTWKSLDIYMRRRNFAWDPKQKTYVPAHTRAQKLLADSSSNAPAKVARIIALFAESGADPKTIAKRVGMRDHRELAEYMRRKGYQWSPAKNNYVKIVGELTGTQPAIPSGNETQQFDLQNYLPLLELLDQHKERIYELLGQSTSGLLPRYAVPGVVRTKSVFMSDLLAKLVKEFSASKNISQREVFEGALIEYLRRYGFKQEIDMLFKQS